MKQNIKLNRTKYVRSIEEFGLDKDLDDGGAPEDPRASKRESELQNQAQLSAQNSRGGSDPAN